MNFELKMPIDVPLGLKWGDEEKGKVVDFIAPKYLALNKEQQLLIRRSKKAVELGRFKDTDMLMRSLRNG